MRWKILSSIKWSQGLELEINIPPQQIFAKCKPGGLIFEGGVILIVEYMGFVLSAVLCISEGRRDYIKLHKGYKPGHMEKQEWT